MKTISLYFQVHQPFRFRRYRFFDIGNDSYYYDDYANETILHKVAKDCYLPANEKLLKAIEKHKGQFRLAFSLTGSAIEQFEHYAPEVLESFKKLNETGCVEFLSETYSHSLVALKNEELFARQVQRHDDLIEKHFGKRPTVFRNTELIYSDEIGRMVHDMGFKAMITEGAKHVLGWKSPNFIYTNAINPRLKILMRNFKLSDDISFRFSNKGWSQYPLTTEKFVSWLGKTDPKDEVINLFMDYETFGEHQKANSGILDFLGALPDTIIKSKQFQFRTPSEIIDDYQPVGPVHVPNPISWADEERDLSAWLGNELQEEAFNKLYELQPRIEQCNDEAILRDWDYLQLSDHFYYMCTKFFSDGEVHKYFNHYDSPYEAFINYMNVLSDFTMRLNRIVPDDPLSQQLAALQETVRIKEEKIKSLELENKKLNLKKKKKKPTTSSKTKKATVKK
ncbi:glycoside hydrolase family 57 protein [Roseimarinus sediminis]|uniref:glycoside hydrolase family 57 protein n=1 Tax=Roseimarinus sediminis TaxID=1610899 RepID=UPI003D1ECE80